MFPCSIVGLLGIVLGLDDGLLVHTFCKIFSFPLDVFYNIRVSGEGRVVRPYDSLDYLIHSLLTLRVDPSHNFFLEFSDLDVEDSGAHHID